LPVVVFGVRAKQSDEWSRTAQNECFISE
jgi:hypothetical protein